MRRFTFFGFLSRRSAERRRLLAHLAAEPQTLVVFESPHRLRALLSDVLFVLGDRRIAVCRELTKAFEEVFRGSVSEALEHFSDPRGEFTIVIKGAPDEPRRLSDDEVRRHLQEARDRGLSARDAVKAVTTATGRSRREVYALWLKFSDDQH
jgi:16S rRNA (cytidine1402-2'-O)-methyltransferase